MTNNTLTPPPVFPGISPRTRPSTDNNSLNISHLNEHPSLIPVIAKWHQDEWHHISPELNTELRIKLYKSYTCDDDIPFGLVSIRDNKPVGSASIVACDMHTQAHLGPWLASVYVHPDFRNQGIATQLIENALKRLKNSSLKSLYLFTPDQADFYQKRGWQRIESLTYHNEPVDIMRYTL